MKTFVIAEAGANHNKDIKTAIQLVKVAAASGASAVKFQSYKSKSLYAKNTPDFGSYKDIPKLIESLELPDDWCEDLFTMCDDFGIEFMCTPFDEHSVDMLYALGVKRMKIAAFESSDPRIVRHVAKTKLPIIFSAGVGSSFESITRTVNIIKEENSNANITILHCNSAYPTPPQDANLKQICVLSSYYPNIAIGLSDHTEGIIAPPIAVALGAKVIEKHYTLSRKSKGPDHPFAVEPNELFEMCRDISLTEQMLGTRQFSSTNSENSGEMTKAMRSVVALKSIKSGEILTSENITTKRPFIEGSIPAALFEDLIDGKYRVATAIQDIAKDDVIKITNIKKSIR